MGLLFSLALSMIVRRLPRSRAAQTDSLVSLNVTRVVELLLPCAYPTRSVPPPPAVCLPSQNTDTSSPWACSNSQSTSSKPHKRAAAGVERERAVSEKRKFTATTIRPVPRVHRVAPADIDPRARYRLHRRMLGWCLLVLCELLQAHGGFQTLFCVETGCSLNRDPRGLPTKQADTSPGLLSRCLSSHHHSAPRKLYATACSKMRISSARWEDQETSCSLPPFLMPALERETDLGSGCMVSLSRRWAHQDHPTIFMSPLKCRFLLLFRPSVTSGFHSTIHLCLLATPRHLLPFFSRCHSPLDPLHLIAPADLP